MANEWLNRELRRVRGQLMSSALAEEAPAVDEEAVEPQPKVDFSSGVRRTVKRAPSPGEQMGQLLLARYRPWAATRERQ
jgi:hypothetical protein